MSHNSHSDSEFDVIIFWDLVFYRIFSEDHI